MMHNVTDTDSRITGFALYKKGEKFASIFHAVITVRLCNPETHKNELESF
jgi:hypothetical protein